ncbi:MAG: 3-oxoacyl-ACP reductase family protein [Betaproteobacteria bacterium]
MSAVVSGLHGKTAIVTGGSRGIGRAIVERLAADGMDVTFYYADNTEAADAVVAQAHASGQSVRADRVDIRDASACVEAVERVIERRERIDLLVNNAGVIRDNLLVALEPADVKAVLDTNVTGLFNVTRAVAPHMTSRRSGRIVNLSSVAATRGGRGQSNYAASKGAIEAFTRALAVELGPRHIRVNAVAPGVIDTEMSKEVRELAGDEALKRIVLRRYGTVDEVAHAVWFLASDLAAYVTGTVLHVDGGFKME